MTYRPAPPFPEAKPPPMGSAGLKGHHLYAELNREHEAGVRLGFYAGLVIGIAVSILLLAFVRMANL